MHLAENEQQARKDVEHGITQWFRYFQNVAAFPQMAVEGGNVDEMVSFVNNGLGVIGTPERAVEQIEALIEQSNGGFGAYIVLAHDWANPEATKRSFELLASEVMPRFQSSGSNLEAAAQRARDARSGLAELQLKAVEEATERHQQAQQAGAGTA